MNRQQKPSIPHLSNSHNKKEITKETKTMLYGMTCRYNENFWDVAKPVLTW